MKKTILAVSAALVLIGAAAAVDGLSAAAGSTLAGVVRDIGGTPMEGVTVTAVHQPDGAVFTARTDMSGKYEFKNIPAGSYTIRFEREHYQPAVKTGINLKADDPLTLNAVLVPAGSGDASKVLEETEAQPDEIRGGVVGGVLGGVVGGVTEAKYRRTEAVAPPSPSYRDFNTEEYARIYENTFLPALTNPLSTFSIDVDTASYANVRRFLRMNQLPPEDAVRVEEMINYFAYDYPRPNGEHPFSVFTEISDCPWNASHRLVHIGIQGKTLEAKTLPPSNLVFLIDVSGSMNSPDKLPLLKSAFRLLTGQMTDRDRVAIVVYAGAAGLVLPSTPGDRTEKILTAIDGLQAGGSTAGGAGIELAYKTAMENLIPKGNNRVILATDGDFNIGVSSTSELVRMVEEKRDKGVFLTVLGFGMGNYKDGRMEQLADKGNGNFHYIDGLLEAKKVFVDDMRGTLFTIAKDVKIQIEFNPAKVKGYRLIGYENRMLQKEDFADDTKDAGELGAGHTVTALYEIIPYGSEEKIPGTDELKYQETRISPEAFRTKELLTVKLRYKAPDGEKSRLISQPLVDSHIDIGRTSDSFRFAAAVAGFGMLLRNSEFKGTASLDGVVEMARGAKGVDIHGYRAEFISLVELAKLLK